MNIIRKRIIPLIMTVLTVISICCLPCNIYAATMPEAWEKPSDIMFTDLSVSDKMTDFGFRLGFTFSKSSELSNLLSLSDDERVSIYGNNYAGMFGKIQLDWKIDSNSDWNDNEWKIEDNGLTKDISQRLVIFDLGSDIEVVAESLKDYCIELERPAEDEIDSEEADGEIRVPVQAIDGNGEPVAAPDKKDNAKSNEKTDEEAVKYPFIDLSEHTIYLRARFVTQSASDEKFNVYSEWTEPVAIGKSAPPIDNTLPDTLLAPMLFEIEIAAYDSGDSEPDLSFDIMLPQGLKQPSTKILAVTGKPLKLSVEVNVNNAGWYVADAVSDGVSYGKNRVFLPEEIGVVVDSSSIQMRARYITEDGSLSSEYSDIISLNVPDESDTLSVQNEPAETVETEPAEEDTVQKSDCPICGMCNQPFGICILIWTAIIVLSVLIIALTAILIRRKLMSSSDKSSAESDDIIIEKKKSGVSSNELTEYDNIYADNRVLPESEEKYVQKTAAPAHNAQLKSQTKPIHLKARRIPADFKPAVQQPQVNKQSAVRYCPMCGTAAEPNAAHCGECGHRL